MARKRDSDPKDRKLQGEKAVSRRDFVKKGAAGVGAAVLSTSGTALAQVSPVNAIQWNYEADVVIIGGGCTGLPAAIRATSTRSGAGVEGDDGDTNSNLTRIGGVGNAAAVLTTGRGRRIARSLRRPSKQPVPANA